MTSIMTEAYISTVSLEAHSLLVCNIQHAVVCKFYAKRRFVLFANFVSKHKAKMDLKSAISLQRGQFDLKF